MRDYLMSFMYIAGDGTYKIRTVVALKQRDKQSAINCLKRYMKDEFYPCYTYYLMSISDITDTEISKTGGMIHI